MRFEKKARAPKRRTDQAVRLKPFRSQQSRQQIDKQKQGHDARQHNHGNLLRERTLIHRMLNALTTRGEGEHQRHRGKPQ
jgi:hypothetical protein